ncbi:MAG: ATP-binding cassette domain-containing protein, partial [Thermoproteota archaeon]
MITSKYQQTGTAVLEVNEVSKAFQQPGSGSQQHIVLSNVSIDVKDGEFVTIVGPSGCGKSTLLNIIAGLESPDSGSIVVRGKSKVSTDRDRAVIFQEGALFPWLTVLENVEFGLKL